MSKGFSGNERSDQRGDQEGPNQTPDMSRDELGYIELPKRARTDDGPSWRTQEGFRDKFLRKTKENPFVPIGLGLTIGALSYGLWQMRVGNRELSQKMMRLRVAAQSFTVVALLTGILYQSTKSKPQE